MMHGLFVFHEKLKTLIQKGGKNIPLASFIYTSDYFIICDLLLIKEVSVSVNMECSLLFRTTIITLS